MKLFQTLILSLFLSISAYAQNAYEGVVKEVIHGGGYTYLQIEEKTKKSFWIAVVGTKVKEGTKVRFNEEMVAKNFKSKSLDRVFDEIMFASNLQFRTDKKLDLIDKVAKESPYKIKGSISIAELFKNRKKYDGQKVTVRAKVVKVSEQIIKRNWIHLQDGTSVEGKVGRIVFTSPQELPNVGDIVTATGVVEVDKDFGSGYLYKVIVENSTFK